MITRRMFGLLAAFITTGWTKNPILTASNSVSGELLPELCKGDAVSSQIEPIVKLTPKAIAVARAAIKGRSEPYLRVIVEMTETGGFNYVFCVDHKFNENEDTLDESQGMKIVVDRKSALNLFGTTIDWIVTPSGNTGFLFNNPHAPEKEQRSNVGNESEER